MARTGERSPRSRWFDPRFAIGLALVIGSIAGVFAIVTAADSGAQVYATRGALSPGDRIHRSDLVVESVRLGGLATKYLSPGDIPDAGLVAARPVAAGELVPTSAVASSESLREAPVVVAVAGELSQAIEPGSVVDVWSAPAADAGSFGEPTVLASSATVVRVTKPDGIVAGETQAVELLIARSKTARVLAAVANGARISLVPASVPIGG